MKSSDWIVNLLFVGGVFSLGYGLSLVGTSWVFIVLGSFAVAGAIMRARQ